MNKIITFYKYIELENPELIRDLIKSMCASNKILGRILIATEGINGAISGKKVSISNFKKEIKKISAFEDLTYREQEVKKQEYHKLVVRCKPEIVNFRTKVNLNNKGEYITPEELNKLIKENSDFILLDARNNYETIIGKFQKAVTLPIETFRDFPDAVKKLSKNKKIITYCTGGIRCEKASAYLKDQGFKEVYQLKGGIVDYINKYPNLYFEGGCFVFDDRLIAETNNEPISKCELCNKNSKTYINCYNLDCDKLFICCETCQRKMNKSCSEHCKFAVRKRKDQEPEKIQVGIVQHYFSKLKVAVIKTTKNLPLNSKIHIKGATTSFSQDIKRLKDENRNVLTCAKDNQIITLEVEDKVRTNDKVFLE